MVVHKQTFKRLEGEEAKLIELTEERTDVVKIDTIQVLTNLNQMNSVIQHTKDKMPTVVENIKKNVSNYNIDLATLQKANEELGLELKMPEEINVGVVLDEMKALIS